ncbi:MAG: VanZ family protein [Planctomycetaceae bacterium]
MNALQLSSDRRIGRRHFGLLAAVSAAGLIYGSWLPFDVKPLAFGDAWRSFQELWSGGWSPYWSRRDVAINVLVTVPLAFALMGTILNRDRRVWTAFLAGTLTIGICFTVSVAVEFGQLWLDTRVTSLRDIAAQFWGSGAGIVLWALAGPRLAEKLDDFLRSRDPARRVEWLLHAYVVGLIVYSLLPFDLTYAPSQIFAKYRSGRIEIVPFTFRYASAFERWHAFLSDLLLYVPVGVWATKTWLPRGRSSRDFWSALAIGMTLSLSVELAQLVVGSRFTSSTDAIWGTLGAAVGIGGTLLWTGRGVRSGETRGRAGIWVVTAFVYTAFLLAVFWFPFEAIHDETLLRRRLRSFADVPFKTMQTSGSDTGALFQMIGDIGWFFPLGVLAALAVDRAASSREMRGVLSAVALLGVAAAAFVSEWGQVVIATRTPDLTESALHLLGGIAGQLTASCVLWRWTSARNLTHDPRLPRRRDEGSAHAGHKSDNVRLP